MLPLDEVKVKEGIGEVDMSAVLVAIDAASTDSRGCLRDRKSFWLMVSVRFEAKLELWLAEATVVCG
jgi:hypothetical protein